MAQTRKLQPTQQKPGASRKSSPAPALKTKRQPGPAPAGPGVDGILRRAERDPGSLSPLEMGRLQNTIGNEAVVRLTRTAKQPQPAAGQARLQAVRGQTVQAKLQVGPADDRYEQEADRAAAEVLAMPAEQAAPEQPPVRRSEEEEVQAMAQDPRAGFEAGPEFEERLRAQQGGGAPLPDGVREFIEPRLGADFSGVRLHTGSEAAQLNRAISAQAFTQGQDIYLAEGQENLASSTGKQLLAHELTHTIQQGAAPVRRRAQTAREADRAAEIQRHSGSALEVQIHAAELEEEELVQTRRADVQRHPIAPSTEVGHEATLGERKTSEMRRIASEPAFIQKVRDSISSLVSSTLNGQEADTKLEQIKTVEWKLVDDIAPANPAQVKDGEIKLFYYHPNWYHPDGNPRVEFIKSTVLHEGLHFISHNHQGFQESAPGQLNIHSEGSLAGADTLDEAVTERIGRELASGVLGATEAYTTNYWNLEARRGLDFHLTYRGLEMLAKGNPQLWLGEMIVVIMDETGLTWPEIKRAYLTDEAQDPEIRRKIDEKRATIGAIWKAKSEAALKTQLGAQAVAKAEWDAALKASVKEVNDDWKAPAPNPTARQSREQIKENIEKKVRVRTGALHEVVPMHDARSSSLDDWKVVRDNTPDLLPPDPLTKAAAWGETITQAKWGATKSPAFPKAEESAYEKQWNTAEVPIPDRQLEEYARKANLVLGKVATQHPMGWVIVPPDGDIKAGDKFSTYPPAAVRLLQSANRNQSLSSLTGAAPTLSAREMLGKKGGAGYEANGEFAAVNAEHVNYATVVHEMGHHRQNKVQGFNEQSIYQVKGVYPLLDLHNILISDNRLAAAELTRNPKSDPVVRLRYTATPKSLRVSEWVKAAANQNAESENFKRFKQRLAFKGRQLLAILLDIEQELTSKKNAALYPGNVPTLFKNMMVEEIMMEAKSTTLRLEKDIDVGHKK